MMERGWAFIREKIPFALTGFIATGINFGVYLLLVDRYLPPGPATVIAYSSSVLLNFFMQRYFVFELRRSVRSAFALSMLVSLGGLLLDWGIVTGLHQFPFLGDQEWVIKGVATGIVFFYNFYAKRRVFEGARPWLLSGVEMPDAKEVGKEQRNPTDHQTTEPPNHKDD
jgi:putative flippase GtrA